MAAGRTNWRNVIMVVSLAILIAVACAARWFEAEPWARRRA